MKIFLVKEEKLLSYILPTKIGGSFDLNEIDNDGFERNIITIEAINGEWRLISNQDYFATENGKRVANTSLEVNRCYILSHSYSENDVRIYTVPNYEEMKYYECSKKILDGITIGKDVENTICISNDLLPPVAATIKLVDNKITITYAEIMKKNNVAYNENEKTVLNKNYFSAFLNNELLANESEINLGDVLFLLGIRIIIFKNEGSYTIGVTNSFNNVNVLLDEKTIEYSNLEYSEHETESRMAVYKREDYFYRKPRFMYNINPISITVDSPPGKMDGQDMPLILTVGPMLTMALTSAMTLYNTISKVQEGKSTYKESMPSLIMCGAMLLSFLFWPLLTNRYQKHIRRKNEKNRKKKYSQYIESIVNRINEEKQNQTITMQNKYLNIERCKDIILNKEDRLWERRKFDDDFLTVSVGFGNSPMIIDVRYPEEHFTMNEDELLNTVKQLQSSENTLDGVPIPFDLKQNYISAVVGDTEYQNMEIKSILLQLCTFHSYEDLKICIFTNREKSRNYSFIRNDNHIWNNEKTTRYFAANDQEYKELSFQLDKVLSSRMEEDKEFEIEEEHGPLFVLVVDSIKRIRNIDLFNKIMQLKKYIGVSIIILNDRISDLPDQCQSFIEVNEDISHITENSSSSINQDFSIDKTKINYNKVFSALANIPIEIKDEGGISIPKKVSFLEMYNISKIESLNSKQRWKDNIPIHSLAVPVGIGENAEKINLDLHEKFHGPHGLIAGMTGSGKSEFIITYILSLAINYNPEEVQFILIDYKGGSLAGAFENPTTGIKLPHLVGTITNLDKNEINRSLSSIESELKRRQELFNIAREKTEESTIDIYKYQEMYRNHEVDTPISHLFIIADEFAELKNQQPEFMDQLISTARIGRSLGVHLILATQKPSGVVDAQIWSNTRFRVCLRVQEKTDSIEVIKRPDAAFLTQTGRFYFQVGFNEIFTLGQSAWAGAKYNPNEVVKKDIDTSVDFINNIGLKVKSVQTKVEVKNEANYGEELINIVRYLSNLANEENIHPKQLWLSRIKDDILVTDLIKKYDYKKELYQLNPVVGEYDLPQMQMQKLLTVPFSKEGNALLYGSTGTGKENFITTLIYSSSLIYTPKEVNYYILDFGSGVLNYFKDSPFVGDIINSLEEEKIENLYKMIQGEIETRKKLFADYNGSYETYLKMSGKELPNIVIVINNYEAYLESYPSHEDVLNVLVRESSRYGIYFLIASTTANGVRFKLKQNFGQVFSLQLNNEDDYSTVLGNVKKVYPSKIFGRGIVKFDNTYEFQTAFAKNRDELSNYIKQYSKEISEKYDYRAKKVPILPEKVKLSDFTISDSIEINLGINKMDLQPALYDFTKYPINLFTSNDIQLLEKPVSSLIYQYINNDNYINIIINAEGFALNDNIKNYKNYFENNFDLVFNKINEFIDNSYNIYKASNFNKKIFNNNRKLNIVIIGINAFISRLNSDNQTNISKIFNYISEMDNINYIFVDTIDKFKKLTFENWFKDNVDNNNGIYIGDGLNEQIVINTSKRIPEMKESVPEGFGFIIRRGIPTYVKFIDEIDK